MPKEFTVNNGDQVRVHVKSRVNAASIQETERNGRKVMIVSSATMPDDIVMNGVKYPAAAIEESYTTLNGSPAPLGHPSNSKGEFVSAREGDGMNGFYFGAFNSNARRENGRVIVDKIIDIEMAKALPEGQRVLEAIENGDPIHTSTGLLCNVDEAGENDGCRLIARDIIFDHDAILLDEEGAATPEQGVGMLVNKAINKDGDPILVINSEIGDALERQIDYYGTELISAIKRREDASVWERVKSAIMEAVGASARETETNSSEVDDMGENKTLEDVSARLNSVEETLSKLDFAGALKAALEPMQNQLDEITKAQNADAEAKKAELVNQVVEKKLLDEAVAKVTPEPALQAMLNAATQTGTAAPILGGMPAAGGGTKYELPKE